jgi:hypothetical protein
MPEENEELTPDRLSRRTLIKRAGVAGALVWSAPVLSSLTSAAHADGSVVPVPCPGGCDPNNPCFGQGPCDAPGEVFCSCVPEVGTGDCFCHESSSCSALRDCTTNADCADLTGYVCATSCCANAKCIPPCGVFVSEAGVAGGPRTTG